MRKQAGIVALVAVIAAVAAIGSAARIVADAGGRLAKAQLSGWQEVPAISSTGQGDFVARIEDDGTIAYALRYANLEGTTTAAAHIHVGQPGVNGGVAAFLCGGGGKPTCPAVAGEVTGVVLASDVIGPAGQGVAAGELDELIAAIRNRVAYVNVHTDKHPGGEIRGHLR